MRAVVQRVSRARSTPGGAIDAGLCILLGIAAGDTAAEADRLAAKIARLRIFGDADGRFDRSLLDTGGAALVVSQFTLLADTARGNRPSFTAAARPEEAEPLYERFCEALRELGVPVQTGVFGARMEVSVVNDGPVTIVLDLAQEPDREFAVSAQLQFDADTARRIEALYLIRDAVYRRELVRDALGAVQDDRILDVGCGPGFYCLELSGIVGLSGSVLGVDSSPAMLQLASARCAGRENVGLLEAEATALPVESGTFDGAVCVQVLEYISDVDAALGELHRALRPGGRAVVWDMDWATVSIHSRDTALTTRVLRAWDEHLADPSLPRTLGVRLRSAGFESVGVEAHAFTASGRDPESLGAALVPLIATFVAGRQGISAVEAEAWGAEQRELMERDEFYFASTQFCFTAMKSA